MMAVMIPTEKDHKTSFETISGEVGRIVYHNPENGFYVLAVKLPDSKDSIRVVGHGNGNIHVGNILKARGNWHESSYGAQFKADAIQIKPPSNKEGIERFLSSGAINGISKVYARRLVETFGEKVLDVIENDLHQLKKVKGIGKKRLAMIRDSWEEQKVMRETMIFLHSQGIGMARAANIYRIYGENTMERITADPYCLARDISGIGFRLADEVARKLGVAKNAPSRIAAALTFLMREAANNGHCGLPYLQLCAQSSELLELDSDITEKALLAAIERGDLVRDTIRDHVCVFARALYHAECAIATQLRKKSAQPPPWTAIDTSKAIDWAQKNIGITLAPGQRQALEKALKKKVFVLTGGPGVGKTTLINVYLTIIKARKVKIELCAPTGRAAKRLSESTDTEAKTIHRLLEVNPGKGTFRRNPRNPLDCDLIIVDEMSMVDIPLFHALLRALSDHAAILMVGDADQLPPVGPGQAFADCLASGTLDSARLTDIFRQAKSSQIIVNAHRVNEGKLPINAPDDHPHRDFYFVNADSQEDALDKILKIVTQRIPRRYHLDPVRDIQILTPMNRGMLGVLNLNDHMRQRVNPNPSLQVEKMGRTLRAGDKVMQTENDYDKNIYNGDIGFIRDISLADSRLDVGFGTRLVSYSFKEIDQLVPAYATTIHKSQGSEYPAVVIPLVTQHYLMLRRDLLYTAMTRGKQLVIIIGQQRAMEMAVSSHASTQRWSMLGKLMQDENHCIEKTEAENPHR